MQSTNKEILMHFLKTNKAFQFFYKYTGVRYVFLRLKSFYIYGFTHNCGGKNSNTKYFGGNLNLENLPKDNLEQIYFNLIMANGIKKATYSNRNDSVVETIIKEIKELNLEKAVAILDIGSSSGIDAINNWEKICLAAKVEKYVMGDLYTEIHYDKKRQLIFDQDGNLLQVLRKNDFVNINFQFTFPFQRITNLPKYLLPYLLKKRYKYPEMGIIKLPMVHPVMAKLLEKKEVFFFERLNVFEPIPGKYDIIICMHLLTDFYFNEDEIRKAKDNLVSTLKPGGFLVVGTAAKHEVIYA